MILGDDNTDEVQQKAAASNVNARIIDGAALSEDVLQGVRAQVAECAALGIVPTLAVIIIGHDPASEIYVRNKKLRAESLGIKAEIVQLQHNVAEYDVLNIVQDLNERDDIHGIIVQMPLPDHINSFKVANTIKPSKDVDGFTVENAGRLFCKRPLLIPCTAAAILYMIRSAIEEDISGKKAVILGRSMIVGMPTFHLLLQQDCTVTILHSKSNNLPEICRSADILVAAIGKPSFVQGSWIKSGACVIDVGINRVNGKLCGDVNFAEARRVASSITPVPRGVGPMTIAFLMYNVVKAAMGCNRNDFLT